MKLTNSELLIKEKVMRYTNAMIEHSDAITTEEWWNSLPVKERNQLQQIIQKLFNINQRWAKKK